MAIRCGWASAALAAAMLIVGATAGNAGAQPPCCEFGSGAFDQQSGQQSQINLTPAGVPFDYRTADDFYLRSGRIYHVLSIEGTMLSDVTILPKVRLELYNDCNGLPEDPPIVVAPDAASIVDTGVLFDGKHVYRVRFDFTDLWLKGGKSYWVSFIGRADLPQTWFWGTAGHSISFRIIGRPGAFKSVTAGAPTWTELQGPPCPTCVGCTDFAFCVNVESCKILNDNGSYLPNGTISLDGPAGVTFARTADDFLIPPCNLGRLCYIEAYIATNCVATAISLYENNCQLPASISPIATLTPTRVINTGQTATINGQVLPILCLQFWNIGITLTDGRDYWISAFGIGNGNAGQVAYFLFNQDCNRTCLIRWNEGVIHGPAVSQPNWVKGSTVFGVPHDYAFLIAVDDGASPHALPGCPVDADRNGTVNVSDIFAFLAKWFAGCP